MATTKEPNVPKERKARARGEIKTLALVFDALAALEDDSAAERILRYVCDRRGLTIEPSEIVVLGQTGE